MPGGAAGAGPGGGGAEPGGGREGDSYPDCGQRAGSSGGDPQDDLSSVCERGEGERDRTGADAGSADCAGARRGYLAEPDARGTHAVHDYDSPIRGTGSKGG